MNQNTAGAVLLLIIAAAGIHDDNVFAYGFAALAAGIAFLVHEAVNSERFMAHQLVAVSLASWAATAAAFFSLMLGILF